MTDQQEFLAQRFEENRGHLRAVAYRMLGSLSEAEDAVQEAWFRLARTDVSEVANLGGWLTTVVSRVCLDLLRSRTSRREDSLDAREAWLPDPVVERPDADPERSAVEVDSIGLAMLVVLDTLPPAERLAFVLHDMFAMPFDEIAVIVDKTPAATRQLASRARKKVQADAPPKPDPDLGRQRKVVEAFLAAARGGDFEALVNVLDPSVSMRVDSGAGVLRLIRGAADVGAQAFMFRKMAPMGRIAVINGQMGIFARLDGKPVTAMAFTVGENGKVLDIQVFGDMERLAALDLPDFD
ncbi:sigma-70 family RNA polymerase sigma factor [Yinghuangia seranimata]|uniref:sigma-70 family RNA polymerase sigma factor n=1 Tax=Yinghuangia seranimata TaxID=408067 RepID=UPI00248B3722|nr:sigma-70 family RNA polymerase sigma factor [Yinghuangia seranimata]MDI2130294.1 sigma-70 family RNA polymerase sigma factor [Yinghuangia seranimata]